MRQNMNHSRQAFRGFQPNFVPQDFYDSIFGSCQETTPVEDYNFDESLLVPRMNEYSPVEEELLNNPNCMLRSVPIIDILCPRNNDFTLFEEEEMPAKNNAYDVYNKIADVKVVAPQKPSEKRIPTVEISPPLTHKKGVGIPALILDRDYSVLDLTTLAKPNVIPMSSPTDKKPRMKPVHRFIIVPPPSVAAQPPPLPHITKLVKPKVHFNSEMLSKFFPLVGIRPARRKETGYADIRDAKFEYFCTVPYKYQFCIIVSSAHPNFENLGPISFSFELEGLVKKNGVLQRRNVQMGATPRNGGTSMIINVETDTKSKKTKKKKKKKKKKKRRRELVPVEGGVKVEFVRENSTVKEKSFVWHIQFVKTSFHYNCRFQLVVGQQGQGREGNVGTGLEIGRTSNFTAVARKKKSNAYKFWERYRISEEEKENVSFGRVVSSSSPAVSGHSKSGGRPKDMPVRTGRKRKRRMSADDEDDEVQVALFEPNQAPHLSFSNIVLGKRKRKRRKIL